MTNRLGDRGRHLRWQVNDVTHKIYEQYLLEVISRECEQRRKSKVQRLLKDSALPLEKSLQNFDLKRLSAKAARQLRTLLDGGFLDRKENVLVFGNSKRKKDGLIRINELQRGEVVGNHGFRGAKTSAPIRLRLARTASSVLRERRGTGVALSGAAEGPH